MAECGCDERECVNAARKMAEEASLLLHVLPPDLLLALVLTLPARSHIAIARLGQVCTVLRQIIAGNADSVWRRQLELLFLERQFEHVLPDDMVEVAASASFDPVLPVLPMLGPWAPRTNIALKPGASVLSLFKAVLEPVEVWRVNRGRPVCEAAWHKAEILDVEGDIVVAMCLSLGNWPHPHEPTKEVFYTLSSDVRSIDWHAEDQYSGNAELLNVGDAVDLQCGPRTRDMNDMSWSCSGTVQRLDWIGKSTMEDFEPQLDASHVPLLEVHVQGPQGRRRVSSMASSHVRRAGAMRHALPIV